MENSLLAGEEDSWNYITIQTDFPVRHAIDFTSWKKEINITDKLYSFPEFIYRHDINKRRVSYLTDKKTPSYAVYKITTKALAIATGVSIGLIAGTILAAKITIFTAGLATPLTTKLIVAGTTLTATAIANYLANQFPIRVFSQDPKIHEFNKEFVTNNLQIPYEFIKGNDYDFIDRDGADKSFRQTLAQIKDSSRGFITDVGGGVVNTFGLAGNLIKYSPYLALIYGGYVIYKKEK